MRLLLRAGWALGDQALSSLTNFALVILVARAVSPPDLGAFALFLAGYTAMTLISTSITAEPLLVRYSGVMRAQWASAVRDATGCTLLLALACSVVLAASAVPLHGTIRSLMLIGALCAPGLLIQDVMRYAFFAGRQAKKAFINDAIWGGAQLGGVIAVTSLTHSSVAMLVLTWAVAGALAGALAMVQAGIVPRPFGAARWLREQRDLWGFILPEFLTVQGANYLSLILIGVIAGVSAVAAVRAAQVLYGPLNVAFNGARVILVPRLVSLVRDRVRRDVRLLALGTAAAAGLWGTLTIVTPPRFGSGLLGQTWALATPLFGFMMVDRAGAYAAEAWRTGLLSLASVKRSLWARVAIVVAYLIAAAVGSAVAGARGAVLAGAIVSALAALIMRQQFALACQPSREEDVAGGVAD